MIILFARLIPPPNTGLPAERIDRTLGYLQGFIGHVAFWSLNIGLAGMIVFALLPAGLWQTYNASIHGYWFARSAEFIHSPLMEALVWGRVPGDIIFAFGAFALCWASGTRGQFT